jgi:hypothetical protein
LKGNEGYLRGQQLAGITLGIVLQGQKQTECFNQSNLVRSEAAVLSKDTSLLVARCYLKPKQGGGYQWPILLQFKYSELIKFNNNYFKIINFINIFQYYKHE